MSFHAAGCQPMPYVIVLAPTRMLASGIAGKQKLTGCSFCQSGRRRKMNSDATGKTAKKVGLKPM
jgi:hypothetical protein